MPRPAYSYRSARKNKARALKQVWRALERVKLGDGSAYVPPIREPHPEHKEPPQ